MKPAVDSLELRLISAHQDAPQQCPRDLCCMKPAGHQGWCRKRLVTQDKRWPRAHALGGGTPPARRGAAAASIGVSPASAGSSGGRSGNGRGSGVRWADGYSSGGTPVAARDPVGPAAGADAAFALALSRADEHEEQAAARRAAGGDAPLGTQLHEPSVWDRPLPLAPVVPYSSLPPRPPEVAGATLYGWIPDDAGWPARAAAAAAAVNAAGTPGSTPPARTLGALANMQTPRGSGRTPPRAAARSAQAAINSSYRASIVCGQCGSGDDSNGNEIVLCDGCDGGWHLACAEPPLDMVPRGKWYCGGCKEKRIAASAERREARDEARRAANAPPPQSEYERQRLENIERNRKVLVSLGLAD